MKILMILAHPERASFNGGLVDVATDTLRVDDGYFAPLTEQRAHYDADALPADVQREIARLDWADLVIFQFPLWWHAQPAILKGWFDRVLVYGGLYSGRARYDRGYFRGKKAICSVTTGSPEQAFMPFGRAGNRVEWLWPIHSSLYYVGYDVLAPQVSYGVQGGGISYQEEGAFRTHLETMKDQWASRLIGLEQELPIPFTGWDDWDEAGVLRQSHPMRWRL